MPQMPQQNEVGEALLGHYGPHHQCRDGNMQPVIWLRKASLALIKCRCLETRLPVYGESWG